MLIEEHIPLSNDAVCIAALLFLHQHPCIVLPAPSGRVLSSRLPMHSYPWVKCPGIDGKKMRQFSLHQDSGMLSVETNGMPAGVYLYALTADGRTTGTKRMILIP